MADIQSNLRIGVDTGDALAQIRRLQRQISAFHDSIRNSGNAANQAISDNLSRNLLNSINSTQKFAASMTTVNDATQSFTNSLERNKLSMGQYFKFAGASTKTFGRLFKNEFNTIETVARDRVKTLQTQYIRMGRDANGALEAIKVRPLRLDMEQLGTQVAMTAQKQQLFNQLIKQGSTNLLNFGKNTQWAGRQLMVGFTIPLSIMGGMAIKEFEKIEKQAIRFKRVYGDAFSTDAETDAALANIRKLATEFTKYGVEVEKTLELAADAAQMGLKGADLTAQVAEATRLAVLGEVEQQEALKATIAVTNTFGIAAEDLAEKINFLNAVENETLTAISDLTIAIPKAGPVVKQLGGSVEDLAFFLTAMKEGGINASEGANALKSALSKVINPTEKASEMLAGYGINLNSIVEGNAGDIKSTILELGKAFDQLDPLSRSRAIEQLFGTFQFARISTLFNNISKEGGQAAKVLQLTQASAAQLAILSERELKRVEDSPIFKLEKAIERLQESLAPLGEEFIKIITPLIDFGTKILKSFNQMDDGAKSFVTNVVTVLGLIAPAAIMTFGLIANGIANFIKAANFVRIMFGKLAGAGTGLNQMTQYMTQEQLEATAAASSLGHSHSMLTTTFNSEKVALDGLVGSYRNAILAMNQYNASAQSRVRPGSAPTQTKKYASGVVSVPGPKGAGDIIPAMLSPGEAVIPAEEAQKYRGFISQMISGNVPEFAKGFLGMPTSNKSVVKNRDAAQPIYEKFLKSKYANTPPTEYGHQLSPTSGHSFPIFGLGGVYLTPAGKKVFVKPMVDENAALAEMRGTQIARQAHGLKAPQQRIVVMRDPMDVKRKRRFLALESDLDPTFVNSDDKAVFNREQYFRQLVASLVRVDKDLAAGNMFGDVVADVGPAGVFSRASGARDYTTDLPSMDQQATINLLGVRGGAKRAFAESTVGLMADMSAEQYHQNMVAEINRVIPMLRQTVAGFKLTDPTEVDAYNAMIKRLEDGRNVDWRKFHAMHSAVKPTMKKTQAAMPKYADGVLTVPGPKGAGDVVPAMLSPGEAVIPAKQAKKYRGFISQMIAGRVPGFNGGAVSVKNATAGEAAKIQTEASRFMGAFPESLEIIEETLRRVAEDTKLTVKTFRQELATVAESMKGIPAGDTIDALGIDRSKIRGAQGLPTIAKQFESERGEAGKLESERAASRAETERSAMKQYMVSQEGMSSEEAEIQSRKTASMSGDNLGISRLHAVDVGMSGKMYDKQGFHSDLTIAGTQTENMLTSQSIMGTKEKPTQNRQAYEASLSELVSTGEIDPGIGASLQSKLDQDTALTEQELIEQGKVLENIFKNRKDLLERTTTGFKRYAVGAMAGAEELSQQPRIPGVGERSEEDLSRGLGRLQKVKLRGQAEFSTTAPVLAKAGDVLKDDAGLAKKDPKSEAKTTANNVAETFLNTLDQGFGIASPSREMYERGRNIVQGIFNGVKDAYRESSGQNLPSGPSYPPDPFAPPPGFETTPQPDLPPTDSDRGRSIGKKLYNKTEKFLENQIYGDGTFGKTKMGQNLKGAFDANNGTLDDQLRYIEGETQLDRSKRELLAQQMNVQAINAGQYSKVGQLLDEEQINIAQQGSLLAQEQSLMMQEEINLYNEDGTLKTRKQLLTEEKSLEDQKKANNAVEARTLKQKRAQDRQSRAGKALGALGTATMVAGMASGVDGVVGEIAQKAMPFLAGLSAIAPILLALPGPLALLAVAVGGIAFGFYKWNEMIDNAKKEGTKLANALSMSTDKLIKFSEATGTVSATEERRRAQEDQLSSATAKQRKFGQEFLGSDFGKEFLDSVKTTVAGGLGEAPQAIAAQIATAVAQGVLTPSQANSIVASIGAELGDYALSGKISLELMDLIGPNGEDLTKEPLKVLLDIQENSMQNLQDSFDLALNPEILSETIRTRISEERVTAQSERDVRFSKGGLDGALAGLESAVTAAGKFFADTGADNPIDWLFEDLTAEPVTGIVEDNDLQFIIEKNKENAKFQAASVQLGINQVQQNQQLLDSLEKQYNTKIATLEEELKSTTDADKKLKLESEINETLAQRKADIGAMNRANKESFQQIVDMQADLDPKVFSDALKNIIDARFEGDEAMATVTKGVLDQISQLQDSDFKVALQLQLASGDLSPTAASRLLEVKDTTVPVHFDITAQAQGIADASQLLNLLMRGNATEEQLVAEFRFAANIDDPEEFDTRLEAINQLSQVPTEYGLEVSMTGSNISAVTGAIKMLEGEPEKISYERILELEEANPGELQGIIDNWDALTGGVDSVTKEIIFDFKSLGTGGDDLIRFYAQATGAGGMIGDLSKLSAEEYSRLLSAAVTYVMGQGKNTITPDPDPDPNPQGGGGTKADPFEDILNRLKQLRKYTIDATGGYKELLKVLGKGKEITGFRGMEQLGMIAEFGSEFASYLSGLDEDTRKLFVEFKKGGPVLTDVGMAMQKAFTDVAIGEFQISIVKSLSALGSKSVALEKLTEKGLDYADALEIATNETLALAIASGELSGKELDEIISKVQELRIAEEVSKTLDQINQDIKDFIDDISVRRKINLNYTDLQEQAILNDSTLRAMVKLGQEGSDAFATRLKQIMSDPDFLNDVFGKGFSNAQEAFRVLEEKTSKAFENALVAGTLADYSFIDSFGLDELAEMIGMTEDAIKDLMDIEDPVSIIEIAEAQIATLNYEMDDLQAQLEQISQKEDEINEKYDKRVEALDKTLEIGKRQAEMQRSQLSIADALSRGDIAAAAAAVAEANEKDRQAYAEDQKALLEKQKESELAAIRSENLLSREELEKRVRDIQNEILEIEESRLEPALRLVELSDILRGKEVEYQTVLDKTREAWDNIKLSVDAANTTGKDFVDTMHAAIAAASALPKAITDQNKELGGSSGAAALAPSGQVGPYKWETLKDGVLAVTDKFGNLLKTGTKEEVEAYLKKAPTATTGTVDLARSRAEQGLTPDYRTPVAEGNKTFKEYDPIGFAEQRLAEEQAKLDSGKLGPGARAAAQKKIDSYLGVIAGNYAMGGVVKPNYLRMGGMIPYKANGGLFKSINTDTVPAMLTPGEFVVRRFAVEKYGTDKLRSINNGTYNGESVYNYEVNVNVKSDANPDQIARAVMSQIKQIDSMRLRGSRF